MEAIIGRHPLPLGNELLEVSIVMFLRHDEVQSAYNYNPPLNEPMIFSHRRWSFHGDRLRLAGSSGHVSNVGLNGFVEMCDAYLAEHA